MTPEKLYAAFESGFARRKFSAGLLIAFIDFLTSTSLGVGSKTSTQC